MKEIQGRTKQTRKAIDIPNLVELQLSSYKWFLEEGLQELFDSFSPIHDFTNTTSISITDFTLGEPKYSIEECRDRDTTFEAPIKAKVLLKQANKEEIETEVYLGDLPLMTDKGTFIINGAERVVVSQLARSPGVYLKDTLDYSGRVLYFATIIPQEGAWVDIETNAHHQLEVRIGQTKKFPVTTLFRALEAFPERGLIPLEMPLEVAQEQFWIYKNVEILNEKGQVVRAEAQKDYFLAMRFAAPLADPKTGEIVAEEDEIVTQEKVAALIEKIGGSTLAQFKSNTSTVHDVLDLFSRRVLLENPTSEMVFHR